MLAPKTIRCAIYTRKSTEEGLEQDYNSLHAQRDACAAYVMSQAGEGWVLLPEVYDDGGFSGGNLERPALRSLMTEIEAKRVDVVVVYKVDRLTRSLSDFSRIVDVLDCAGASFVSITQAFNTTTSMGSSWSGLADQLAAAHGQGDGGAVGRRGPVRSSRASARRVR